MNAFRPINNSFRLINLLLLCGTIGTFSVQEGEAVFELSVQGTTEVMYSGRARDINTAIRTAADKFRADFLVSFDEIEEDDEQEVLTRLFETLKNDPTLSLVAWSPFNENNLEAEGGTRFEAEACDYELRRGRQVISSGKARRLQDVINEALNRANL